MTDARYTYTAGMPAARVGSLVARARSVAGISDRDLAGTLGVSLRTIRRWERGDLVPTDDEIEAIASACGTRLTELLPRRTPVSYDRATGIMRMGEHAIAIPGSLHDNDAVLGAFVGMVRRQRGLRPDQDVKVRQEDLEALGEALDLDDGELEERLVRVIGLSRTQAAAVRAQLLRRRLAVPMVGMLAGLGLVGVNRLFTTATEQVRTVGGGTVTRGNPYLAPTTTTTAGQPVVYLPTSMVPVAPATAPAESATLPPVVTAEPPAASPQTDVRTGPPRSTRPRVTTPSTDPPSSDQADPAPVDSAPVTAPPSTPPPTLAPTPPPATPPPTAPPVTEGPVVPTVPAGGVTETTERPAPTTTTTVPHTTTTPPSTTTTPPTTSATLGGDSGGSTMSGGSGGNGNGNGSGTGTGSGGGAGTGSGSGTGTS